MHYEHIALAKEDLLAPSSGLVLEFMSHPPASCGEFSKAQSGKMGPVPGRFELSKGILKGTYAMAPGFETLNSHVLRIEPMRTHRIGGFLRPSVRRAAAVFKVVSCRWPQLFSSLSLSHLSLSLFPLSFSLSLSLSLPISFYDISIPLSILCLFL